MSESNRLYISTYHYTRDLIHSRYPGIKGLDIGLFKKQLEFFKEKFNVVSMEEVIDAIEGRNILPENALLLTFDDGYTDNYLYAFPLLEEYGFQGAFFLSGKTFDTHQLLDANKIHYILASTDAGRLAKDVMDRMDFYRGSEFEYPSNEKLWNRYAQSDRFDDKETIFVKRMLQTVLPEELRKIISSELFTKYMDISEELLAYELYMSKEQIRTMKRHGMFIGVHGYDHYWLGNLPKDQMRQDISKALEVMDEFIDNKKWVMNYPYGSYNEDVIEYVRSRGACIGLTVEPQVAITDVDNRFELPRFDCNDFPPKSENYRLNNGQSGR